MLGAWPVLAFVMSSDSYHIQQDSINIGGTEDSASNSYKLKDTAGEIATGKSSSNSYNLYAGYRQMNETYISVSLPDNVTLTPAIGGVTGGTGNGFVSWTIITDNNAGFTATLKASSTMMVENSQGDNIQAYTEAVNGVPDYDWTVAANAAEFGYHATTTNSTDLDQSFKSAGSSPCNTGSTMANNQCWLSASTSPETLINRATETTLDGVILGIKFQVEIDNHVVIEDTYTATTTVTMLTL